MNTPLWAFDLKHRQLRVQLALNGAVVYRWSDAGYNHYTLKINSRLVEGDNRLTVQLGPLVDGEELSSLAELAIGLYAAEHGGRQEDVRDLVVFAFNADDHDIQKDGLTQVLVHDFEVTAAESFGRWAWQDATPYIPNERLAVETLVGKLHAALIQKDAARVIDLCATRHTELARSVGLPASEGEKSLSEGLEGYFADDDWSMEDIDYAALRLYPSEDGRLVEVLDHDGRPPLRGAAGDGRPFAMKVVVSLIDNQWQVVR